MPDTQQLAVIVAAVLVTGLVCAVLVFGNI